MFMESPPSTEQSLTLTDTFRFACHKELACFNRCCCNKHLPLTPYDLLRLKEALSLHSDDLLAHYVVFNIDPQSGFPVLAIGMRDDPKRSCPFLSDEGCKVYPHRPTACRLFPLARISGIAQGAKEKEEFYYLLDIPECLGFGEEQTQSVEEWRNHQGLQPYLEMNDKMIDLVLRVGGILQKPLDERQLQKVMVACYNLDVFREFVFRTNFLDIYEVNERTRLRIEKDDTALLELGFNYLKRFLLAWL